MTQPTGAPTNRSRTVQAAAVAQSDERKRTLLKRAGAIVLFLSWLSQNYVQRSWQDQREELDRLRLKIVTNEILSNVWYSSFVDQEARPEIDLIPAATIGLQYINFSHQVRAAAATWHQGAEAMVAESRRLLDDAKAAQEKGDLSKILDLADKARSLDERASAALVPDNENRYRKIRAEEDRWGRAFTGLYILGAGLLGLATLFRKTD